LLELSKKVGNRDGNRTKLNRFADVLRTISLNKDKNLTPYLTEIRAKDFKKYWIIR